MFYNMFCHLWDKRQNFREFKCKHKVFDYIKISFVQVKLSYNYHSFFFVSGAIFYIYIEFVREFYKTWEMCDKAINRCVLYFVLFPLHSLIFYPIP